MKKHWISICPSQLWHRANCTSSAEPAVCALLVDTLSRASLKRVPSGKNLNLSWSLGTRHNHQASDYLCPVSNVYNIMQSTLTLLQTLSCSTCTKYDPSTVWSVLPSVLNSMFRASVSSGWVDNDADSNIEQWYLSKSCFAVQVFCVQHFLMENPFPRCFHARKIYKATFFVILEISRHVSQWQV